jgi:tRNA uridine 5-carbamoylmethylation protein Kti12
MKNIIFMNGIPGSGKSYIAKKIKDYLNIQNIKSIIISKDDYRYTSKGYVFELNSEFEKSISIKYFNDLIKYVAEYEYIILDNTHFHNSFIEQTFNELKNYEINYIFLCIRPTKNIEWHVQQNKH